MVDYSPFQMPLRVRENEFINFKLKNENQLEMIIQFNYQL